MLLKWWGSGVKVGCLSDPKGYVLGRFQVKGKDKTPGHPCGGGGGVDN